MSRVVTVGISPIALVVNPGESATATLTIRNTGTIVERFSFEVLGDMAEWARLDPDAVSLLPNTERTVDVRFSPPRAPKPTAGMRPFGIKVVPSAQPSETAVTEGDITVTPFAQLAMAVRPGTAKGTWKGRFRLFVQNIGNSATEAEVSPIDPDDVLTFRVFPRELEVPPGSVSRARISVRPRRVMTKGNPERRNFKIGLIGDGAPTAPQNVTLVQRPVLARWVPRAAVIGAALITGGILYARSASAVHDVATTAPTTTTTVAPTTTTPPTTAPPTTAGGGPTTTAAASGTPAADANVQFAPNECTTYDPLTGVTVDTTNNTVSLGGSMTLPLDSAADAKTAGVVAQHFGKLCIIGKGGSAAQQVYVWLPQPPTQPLSDITPHRCQAYRPSQLQVVPLAGFQSVQDASSGVTLASLASTADADRAIQVAKDHQALCWVGGGAGATGLSNLDYAHAILYWD